MKDLYQVFFQYVGIFFVLYLVGYASFLMMSVTVGSSELWDAKRRGKLKNELKKDYYVPVTIVVPAHNESVTIEATVRSLLALKYSLYEIVVVDDGSTDETSDVMVRAFSMKQIARPIQRQLKCQPEEAVFETRIFKVPVTLIRKKNGGKADALNMGINAARYPYFICMDADSVLQNDSLEKIVRPVLGDDHVIAVGGTVRPCNGAVIKNGQLVKYGLPKKLLACMQELEYDRSFLASRILFDKFNGSIIISGAFGLLKKSMVINVGGYAAGSLGEDMELVVTLHVFCREHEIPYRIRYAADAVCWTQVPERFRDLAKQRRRWHIGLFQSMMEFKRIFFNPKYGLVSFVSYMYFLLYELLSPYIEVFGVLTVLFAFYVDLINVPFMILFFLIYAVYSAVLSLTAFFSRVHTADLELSASDMIKAVGLCFFEVSCLRFALAGGREGAPAGYRRKKNQWGRIERKKIDFD